jgi:hypothetical protein
MIATTIIELAKAGERNVDVLSAAALNVHTGAVSAPNPPPLPGSPPEPRVLHLEPRPVGGPTRRVGALGRPAVLSSLSYTTTLRSLSALMILLFSGL